MTDLAWYLTRATGIVAAVLMVWALLWGLLFSARATGKRPRPAWWLDLHNWLGGLSLVFVVVHILASWIESADIGPVQILVPGTSAPDRWGISWGVLATYLLTLTVLTTWPKRLSNRRWWRIIHLTSIAASGFALAHAMMSGSDFGRLGYRLIVLFLSFLAFYGVFERLLSLVQQRRRAAARAALRERKALAPASPGAPAVNDFTDDDHG